MYSICWGKKKRILTISCCYPTSMVNYKNDSQFLFLFFDTTHQLLLWLQNYHPSIYRIHTLDGTLSIMKIHTKWRQITFYSLILTFAQEYTLDTELKNVNHHKISVPKLPPSFWKLKCDMLTKESKTNFSSLESHFINSFCLNNNYYFYYHSYKVISIQK